VACLLLSCDSARLLTVLYSYDSEFHLPCVGTLCCVVSGNMFRMRVMYVSGSVYMHIYVQLLPSVCQCNMLYCQC